MSQRPQPIAVFGGSFDPPHVAHVLVSSYVLSTQHVASLLVIPTYQHPLGKRATASYDDRVAMCELALADLKRVEVSRLEGDLRGPSQTLRTLEVLYERNPGRAYRLVMGADLLDEVDRWHAFDRISELAPPIVIGRRRGREGDDDTGIALADVSSSDVRARLARGADVSALVPAAVQDYIRSRRLYAGEKSV